MKRRYSFINKAEQEGRPASHMGIMTDENIGIKEENIEIKEDGSEEIKKGHFFIKDEIDKVQALLEPYGFSFFELVACPPKGARAKGAVADSVAVLVENPAFFSMMRSNLELPMKELVKYSGAPRRIIEKHRKYIIAAAEILNGEFPELGEYFSYISKVIRK